MKEELPLFRYHPDPIATGAIEISDERCTCCERARGYIYRGAMYTTYDVETLLCPWCISDGSAAKKFEGSFNDVNSMIGRGIPASVVQEVNERTPSYSSWQEVVWLYHCSDACEFHGDASADDVRNAVPSTFEAFLEGQEEFREHWLSEFTNYQPNEDLVFYKYKCRHCRMVLLTYEYS
ncbi:hypothetical protein SAMN03159444_02338 [Pseudomonas sp. NFACC02]|uniref:CbrC family protein n=1 Tax=Pseudomonas TaxID=286 RepID=UPI000786792D|nr:MULTISPECIES: CbrC family protein [Pseudomonas]SEQ72359.1 hypothetical protein SAMN03159444_02338 [Pseudomonas sp. NFACC02]